MYESADLVVTANVLKGSTLDRSVSGLPISRVVLKVEDTYAGQSVPVILLEQTRGDGLEVEDDPGYIAGDNYLLYLREITANTYRVVNPTGRIRQ